MSREGPGRYLPIIIPAVLIAVGLPVVLAIALNNRDDDNQTENPAVNEPTVMASPSGASRAINVVNREFEPADLSIATGETVTFRNTSQSEHRIEIDGDPDMPIRAGETTTWKAEEPGVFDYLCTIHPNEMKGTITVGR